MDYDPSPMAGVSPPRDAEASRAALLAAIEKLVPNCGAAELRDLAEAWAWVVYPNQSHGGSAGTKTQ
jgi:hypothetical protein